MAETLTFGDFQVGRDSVYNIGAVPENDGEFPRPGVIEEIEYAFGYKGNNLGELIGQVAPYKTLQDNIEHAKETLSVQTVRDRIGHGDKSAIEIACDWGERSGLQDEVFRPLMQPEEVMKDEDRFAVAVITDGVVNWMNRMTSVAEQAATKTEIPLALLVSGGRAIGSGEHPDVEGGTSSREYMGSVLEPKLRALGLFAAVITVDTEQQEGQSVMARASEYLQNIEEVDLARDRILVPSVAGNWMQKGSQARSALRKAQKGFDRDSESRQLWVVSDSFPLGETGEEPKGTHQNPFSAIGNILRGAKLLDEVQRFT